MQGQGAEAAGSDASDFLPRWRTSRPPMRPHANVAAAVADLLPPHDADAPILLLGVTPELAVVPHHLLAVDRRASMIAGAWPGDTATHRAVLGDWRALPVADAGVAGALGDASFGPQLYPSGYLPIIRELLRVVRPGGRIILRCFATPDEAETVEALGADVLAGGVPFHAFKMRLNMAVGHEHGDANGTSDEIFRRFAELFPDREALSRATGWSLAEIAELDWYAGCDDNHSYPSRAQLAALWSPFVRSVRFVETQGYPLAERCPLLVADL